MLSNNFKAKEAIDNTIFLCYNIKPAVNTICKQRN
jgi:hypothetical protein